MSDLQLLLQRIQPPEPKAMEKPPEPSKALETLFTRMENRKWKEHEIAWALALSEQHTDNLKFIQHVRKCEQCQFELTINIERYQGRHAPWYLNLEYETGWYPDVYEEDPLYKTAPRINKYDIGSYWTGTSKDTLRFISDRMNWAEEKIRRALEAVADYVVALEEWNLTGEPPTLLIEPELESLLNFLVAA